MNLININRSKAVKKVIFQLLFAFILVSCSTEENPVEEQQSHDSTPPQITVSSIPPTIESISDFQVTISDDSSVKTSIYIDDVLVTEENSKNFSVEIDPFDYSTGSKTLQVISTDSGNNEASVEIGFELKKLLFILPNPISDNALGRNHDQFISINLNDGSLYMAKKIESDEDGKFYANDDFERQQFTVSMYSFSNRSTFNEYYIYSFANIEPGTVVMSASERYDYFNLGNLPSQSSVLLDLSELDNPMMFGYNAQITESGGGLYFLNYSSEASEKFFMYDFPLFGDVRSDYSYTLVTNLEKTTYSSSDLSTAENFASITIPVQDDFFLAVDGYQTESDYKENKFYRIFSVYKSTASTFPVEIPVFPDLFDVYNLTYSYTPDNRSSFYAKRKGLEGSLSTNHFKVLRDGPKLNIEGEHDYSVFSFEYASNSSTVYSIFDWTFHFKESQNIKIPFEDFEIPEQILDILQAREILPKPSMVTSPHYTLDFKVYDYQEPVIYENMMFGSSYNQNEGGDVSYLKYNLKL